MKIKLKLNLDCKFEIQRKSKKKIVKKNNKFSFLKTAIIWVVLEIISTLLSELVTWIIRTFMNGSFYFNNGMFLFERKRVLYG